METSHSALLGLKSSSLSRPCTELKHSISQSVKERETERARVGHYSHSSTLFETCADQSPVLWLIDTPKSRPSVSYRGVNICVDCSNYCKLTTMQMRTK